MSLQALQARIQSLIGTKGMDRLGVFHVGVVGQGSLGSPIAIELAMGGVGYLTLIDPDDLSIENIWRHAADDRYLGWSKVDAVRDLILHRNPNAQVFAHKADALTQPELLAPVDLVIVAGLGSELATSQLARSIAALGKPAIFAGLFDKAAAGDAFYVDPNDPNGPCYGCFSSLVSDMSQGAMADRSAPVVYGMAPDEVKAVPGLDIHIKRGALVVADWALRIGVSDQTVMPKLPGNYVVYANQRYELGTDAKTGKPIIVKPGGSQWLKIKKDPACLTCGSTVSESGSSIDELLG